MKELSGCVIKKEKTTLLLHRIDKKHWELPGGKIREIESREETAIRETKEEIGCDVKLETYLGYDDFEIENKKFRSHKFKAEIIRGEPKIQEPEVFDEIKYIDINNTKEKLAPNLRK